MVHTHDIEISGGSVRKTYVSWEDGEPDREWAALEHLHVHAPGLAPRPLSRHTSAGRPVVVMSRVEGEPLASRLSDRQTGALADALGRLFAVPVPVGLPDRANGPVDLAGRLAEWLAHDYDWDLCQDPALVRRAVTEALSWLDDFALTDDWILDPVVALGDGNLDNVLWDGRSCRLIDWEEYGASDLAYEIADVVEHASSRLGRRLDVAALLARLAPDREQHDRIEVYRTMFACFWLAMLLPGNGGWRRNPAGSTEDQAGHLLSLLGATRDPLGPG